tara:strand:+ start:13571 stop:14617 length:1047 start_codon:yes stop_codon:yes gene_type:complete
MLDLNTANTEDIVSRDGILKKISDEQIFRHYIGDFKLNKAMTSPIRKDNVPSFGLFYSSHHQKLMFKDHATGAFGDAFDIVRHIFGLSLYQACVKINIDFNLGFRCPEARQGKYEPVIKVAKRNIDLTGDKQLGVKFRKWKQCDYNYWTVKYDINEKQLKYFNIFPIDKAFLGRDVIWSHRDDNPIYAYIFFKDGKYTYKCYRPREKDKRYKWISSTNRTVLQGWDQLPATGDTLILTKSLKDVLVYRTLGFFALSCQNELGMIKDTVIEELRGRFKRIVLNNDFDYAGVTGTNLMKKAYNLPYFFLQDFRTRSDGYKDISDYREWHTKDASITLIKNKLRIIWPMIY